MNSGLRILLARERLIYEMHFRLRLKILFFPTLGDHKNPKHLRVRVPLPWFQSELEF